MAEVNRNRKPRVVIIGAGFGGLWAARTLAQGNVDVLVIDRNNYHTFLALLYQVAAAELEAEDIAYPIRSIFWKLPNVDFTLAHARRIDLQNRIIETDGESISYDYLILATGSITYSFGLPGVAENAYYLKTLEEAVALKNHIICCFEAAAREKDKAQRESLLTFVIVGGGATGVEYAGALSELIHGPLVKDYRTVDFQSVRIILLEAADGLAANMPQSVRAYTLEKLQKMGVDVRLGAKVREVTPNAVLLSGQDNITTQTIVWTAGVKGEPLAELSGVATGRDGRVPVRETLQVLESAGNLRHWGSGFHQGRKPSFTDGRAGGHSIRHYRRAKYPAANRRTNSSAFSLPRPRLDDHHRPQKRRGGHWQKDLYRFFRLGYLACHSSFQSYRLS